MSPVATVAAVYALWLLAIAAELALLLTALWAWAYVLDLAHQADHPKYPRPTPRRDSHDH